MKQEEYLAKLMELEGIDSNELYAKSLDKFGFTLLFSFGLDTVNPENGSDATRGFNKAKDFLNDIKHSFTDPNHIVGVAPFSYAYLGEQTFNQVLDVVKERAQAHPDEQVMLDELFTGAALLSPELRQQYIDEVRATDMLNDQIADLESLIVSIDPKANFTSPDQFPQGFPTNDVLKAMDLLKAYLQLGVFKPGAVLSDEYHRLKDSLNGFEYLIKEPSMIHAVVIAKAGAKKKIEDLSLGINKEYTSKFDARPYNSGENPGIVFVGDLTAHKDIQRIYPHSTILYIAESAKKKTALEKQLAAKELIVDLSDKSQFESSGLMQKHLRFITGKRAEHDLVGFDQLIEKDLEKIETTLTNGNELFYDLQNAFEKIGRKDLVDAIIKKGNYDLPKKVDHGQIMLLSRYPGELTSLFEMGIRKKITKHTELPPLDETGTPFIIFTSQEIPQADIYEQIGPATVIYLADDEEHKKTLIAINNNDNPFILNVERLKSNFSSSYRVGKYLQDAFFNRIAKARNQGITEMNEIVHNISTEIKMQRDKLLFSSGLYDFYAESKKYYDFQETFKYTPEILQLSDEILMQACPSGGCLNLELPKKGFGCRASTNLPDVIIDFAVKYRQQVGDSRFIDALNIYHSGKTQNPWYLRTRQYGQHFDGLKTANVDRELMTF